MSENKEELLRPPLTIRLQLHFDDKNMLETVYQSLKPEERLFSDDKRAKTQINLVNDDIEVIIEAYDISKLKAIYNSYFYLLKTILDTLSFSIS